MGMNIDHEGHKKIHLENMHRVNPFAFGDRGLKCNTTGEWKI
jgi:hypothetical protein